MDRINIYGEQEGPDGRRPLIGWFDRDAAKGVFTEDTNWDGSNHVSVATGSQWDHEELYCTAQDRWVLRWWSQWQGRQERYSFITPDQAREWLLANNRDQDVEAMFGEVEQERGPGRPAVGTPINIRLSDQALGRVDQFAADNDVSRAAAVRQLVGASLDIFTPRPGRALDLPGWLASVAEACCALPGRTVADLLGILAHGMTNELAGTEFSETEADVLAAVLQGTVVSFALGSIAYRECSDAFDIARDSPAPDISSYAAQFGIDEDQLLQKLAAMTPLGDLALRLAIARWWQLPPEQRQDGFGYQGVGLRIAAAAA